MDRRSVLAALTVAVAGCVPPPDQRRELKKDAKIWAWMAAGNSYKMMRGMYEQWGRTLTELESKAIPLLEELKEKGFGVKFVFAKREGGTTTYVDNPEWTPEMVTRHGLIPVFPPKGGVQVPKIEGLPEKKAREMALMKEMNPEGVDKARLAAGNVALYHPAVTLMGVEATTRGIRTQLFYWAVMKEEIKKGKKADWMDKNRPAEESLADFDLATRITGETYPEIQSLRVRILVTLALIRTFDSPAGLDELEKQLAEERAHIDEWMKTHREPTQEEYGVVAEKLPTAEETLASIFGDHTELMNSVFKATAGVLTGNPDQVMQAIAGLMPEDSVAAIVLNGMSDALNGKVGKLTGTEEEVATANGAVKTAKNAVGSAKSMVDRLKRVAQAMPGQGG